MRTVRMSSTGRKMELIVMSRKMEQYFRLMLAKGR